MTSPQEHALELCQQIENSLREVQKLALLPGTASLSACEMELRSIVETLRQSMPGEASITVIPALRPGDTTIRPSLQQIRQIARQLQTQFAHGSNFCMGLLQIRLGTGYSEQGLPVLIPSSAKSSFEG